MEISINNFNYKNLAEDKKALEKYSEKEDSVLKKEVDARVGGFWGHTIQLFIFLTIVIAIESKLVWIFLFLYIPIWFYYVTTIKSRRKKAFLKEKKKNANTQVINYVDVLKIFLEKEEEVVKLGKAFLVKSNKVTGNKKREYFGDVLIFLDKDKNEIYLLNEEKLYQKEFSISDIVAFSRVSAEGLGNIKGRDDDSQMVDYVHRLDKHADQLKREATVTRVTDRSWGFITLQSDIRADSAAIREKKARDELHKKREKEEKRLKDELEIRLLEFADGDYLLISHLEDSAVSHLEKMIEIQ